jgi:hypothetical protein
MKTSIETSQSTPSQVMASEFLSASAEVRIAAGRLDTIRRTLRRQKRGAMPEEPKSTALLHLDDTWQTTGGANPRQFLIYDNGTASENRILVFASREQLRQLAYAERWFMDGNFAMAPTIFEQLYIIRVPLSLSCVTCAYALLPNKAQATYEEMLTAIANKCDELGHTIDPTIVITDFEKASMQATKNVIGQQVKTQGCFYHLTQSTWRKIQELGLVTLYTERADVRHFCGMIDGLAFLPIDKVTDGMLYLKEHLLQDVPSLDELLTYFDTTYVSGTLRRIQRTSDNAEAIIRFRRINPIFPPETWNVYEATLSDTDRTNNFCEGWNNSFRSLCRHHHPSIWTIIEALRMDEALATTAIEHSARGEPPIKRTKRESEQRQQRLRNICVQYESGQKDLVETLTAIGYCIRLQRQ